MYTQPSILLPPGGRMIAVGGGPGSGKTTFVNILAADGEPVCIEAATHVISGTPGLVPGIHFQDPAALQEFQLVVTHTTLLLQRLAALANPGRVITCDRAVFDGDGYLVDGMPKAREVLGVTQDDLYVRYIGAIFFELPPREIWEAIKANNPARHETWQEAEHRAACLWQVWRDHPNITVIPGDMSWDERVALARTAREQLLAT